MATEIERKFLVRDDSWREAVERSIPMRQGYLQRDDRRSVRVRIFGDRAHINIKASDDGIHRHEFEYEIPLEDAEALFRHVVEGPVVEKVRHELHYGDHLWEVDEFQGANAPLVLAEIELQHADEPFERPPWLGQEVSSDRRYYNSNLAVHPYGSWGTDADADG
ncbi:MAG TPA: CYTH domain-containing protein [Gammaproteobacteria bacterium]|nr:CYTH domain-containing protein [Gammaproteobacteria bacterium]